jgi:hypothetical protein
MRSIMMINAPKEVVRITARALGTGRLGLEWEYADGTSEAKFATPATIIKVFDDFGHSINSEALSQIAFCGHRRVLNLRRRQAAVVSTQAENVFLRANSDMSGQ